MDLGVARLAAQHLEHPTRETADDLVAWFGAVQAQDYAGSKWALGVRLPHTTDASIEELLDRGAILRTHAFRFTWQLIAPADVRWMLSLVTPRLKARAARRNEELELDAATLRRSRTAIQRALRDGQHLTRKELAGALERAGIDTSGGRLSHLLAHAELDAVICSGARKGKQSTYALLEVRAPKARPPLPREEALAELALRYVRSRGPATAQDFAWWAGLAPSDARLGLDAIGAKVVRELRDGQTYFHAGGGTGRSSGAWLLPPFDEYLIAYRVRDAVLDPAHVRRVNAGGGLLDPVIVMGGRVVGRWRRTIARGMVTIALEPFEGALPPHAERAIRAAAQRYARFLGLSIHAA